MKIATSVMDVMTHDIELTFQHIPLFVEIDDIYFCVLDSGGKLVYLRRKENIRENPGLDWDWALIDPMTSLLRWFVIYTQKSGNETTTDICRVTDV